MVYNYIRFDSVLEFGAKYNLTGFDMSHRGWIFERLYLGIFEFLFQPFAINGKFPYVYTVAGMMSIPTDFLGQTINEPLTAGYFPFVPISIFLLGYIKNRDIRKNRAFAIAIWSVCLAVVLIIIDIQVVGLTMRYLSDFSVFLLIPTVIIILDFVKDYENNKHSRYYKILFCAIIVLSAITIFINNYALLASGRYNDTRYMEPRLYYNLKYLFK